MLNTHPTKPSRFGKKLKYYRDLKGLFSTDLARRAKVPQSTISKLETGAMQYPSVEVAFRLAQALGVTLDSFFKPTNRKEANE